MKTLWLFLRNWRHVEWDVEWWGWRNWDFAAHCFYYDGWHAGLRVGPVSVWGYL